MAATASVPVEVLENAEVLGSALTAKVASNDEAIVIARKIVREYQSQMRFAPKHVIRIPIELCRELDFALRGSR